MGSFLLIVHPRRSEAEALMDRWVRHVAWMPGLETGRALGKAGGLAWSVGRRAPVHCWESPEGEVGLVIGDAVEPGNGRRVNGERAAEGLSESKGDQHEGYDGFHVAMALGSSGQVTVSADHLGFFPVFWGVFGEAFFVSSTPSPVFLQANWTPTLDLEGLAGFLLVQASLGGRTLISGVRRLAPGRVLVRAPDGDVSERRGFAFSGEESLADLDEKEQTRLVHEGVRNAVERSVPKDEPVGLLLTGGKDSRLLGGYLRDGGREVKSLTLGEATDHEARVAARIAEALGFSHQVRSIPWETIPAGLELQIGQEQLGNGAIYGFWWGASQPLGGLARRTVCGHAFDLVVGGVSRVSGTKEWGFNVPFEEVFEIQNRLGIPEKDLAQNLTPVGGAGFLGPVLERLRDTYFAGGPPAQRPWRLFMAHVERFLVASMLWRISFHSWPVVPILDRDLLTLVSSVSSPLFHDRKGQDRILVRYFPELARITHVSLNAERSLPLLPSLRDRILFSVRDRIPRGRSGFRGRERRFIRRMTDFDNPGWRQVREKAEPSRDRLTQFLEPKFLADYLPPPNQPFKGQGFHSPKGRKFLLGLALWMESLGE